MFLRFFEEYLGEKYEIEFLEGLWGVNFDYLIWWNEEIEWIWLYIYCVEDRMVVIVSCFCGRDEFMNRVIE